MAGIMDLWFPDSAVGLSDVPVLSNTIAGGPLPERNSLWHINVLLVNSVPSLIFT
jgi:hypothetical protein